MDCLFCKIASREIPALVVYEDEAAVGVLDVNPRAPGHTMIIPKQHSENLLDLPEDAVGPVFRAVQGVTALLKQALAPDGFTIGINHGRVSGQSVDHLHIHVIPRWSGDGGGSVHSVVSNPPKETLEAMRDKILKSKNNQN